MLRLKVCGITQVKDAIKACQLGADAIGFIFYPPSPRYISFETAKEISAQASANVSRVGVFVSPTRADIERSFSVLSLDAVQIHGQRQLDKMQFLGPERLIPAFQIKPGFDIGQFALYRNKSAALLLDAYQMGMYGGTGKTFDWQIAVEAKTFGRIILSGGITPENVRSAVEQAAPYAIDVNSGVEISPGIKDHRKLEALFKNIEDYRDELPGEPKRFL